MVHQFHWKNGPSNPYPNPKLMKRLASLNCYTVLPGMATGVFFIPVANLPLGTTFRELTALVHKAGFVEKCFVYPESSVGWVRVRGACGFESVFNLLDGMKFKDTTIYASRMNEYEMAYIWDLARTTRCRVYNPLQPGNADAKTFAAMRLMHLQKLQKRSVLQEQYVGMLEYPMAWDPCAQYTLLDSPGNSGTLAFASASASASPVLVPVPVMPQDWTIDNVAVYPAAASQDDHTFQSRPPHDALFFQFLVDDKELAMYYQYFANGDDYRVDSFGNVGWHEEWKKLLSSLVLDGRSQYGFAKDLHCRGKGRHAALSDADGEHATSTDNDGEQAAVSDSDGKHIGKKKKARRGKRT